MLVIDSRSLLYISSNNDREFSKRKSTCNDSHCENVKGIIDFKVCTATVRYQIANAIEDSGNTHAVHRIECLIFKRSNRRPVSDRINSYTIHANSTMVMGSTIDPAIHLVRLSRSEKSDGKFDAFSPILIVRFTGNKKKDKHKNFCNSKNL